MQFAQMNSNKSPPVKLSVPSSSPSEKVVYSTANVSLRGCKLAGESADLLSLLSKTAALYKVDKQLC